MPTTVSKSATDEAREARWAVEVALNYFQALFKDALPSNASMEEIELSSDRKHWLVTLSFEEPRRKNPQLPEFMQIPRQKLKVFKVERKSGLVVSVKTRNDG
jgi:hypothetical protein